MHPSRDLRILSDIMFTMKVWKLDSPKELLSDVLDCILRFGKIKNSLLR